MAWAEFILAFAAFFVSHSVPVRPPVKAWLQAHLGQRGFTLVELMVVIVIFALAPPWWVSLILVMFLSITMFVPLKFVHPVRTQRWRNLTLPMALAWTFFAGWAAWVDFHAESWAHWGLIITSVYLLGAGIAQQIIPERSAS